MQIKNEKLSSKIREIIGKNFNNKQSEVIRKIQSTIANLDQKATDLKNYAYKKMKELKNYK